MYRGLSPEQAPPLSVPARFFVTAPVFGALAALILLLNDGPVLVSRWTPALLAITHCLVLGFFTSVMLGALQQMLPVLAGAIIPHPQRVASVVHIQWVLGVVLLVAAFLYPGSILFIVSLILLIGGLAPFIVTVLLSLARSRSANQSVTGTKFAVVALLVTSLLGVLLALGHANAIPLERPWLTDLHLTWGLLAWIGILIIAVAWQVVPMFQITPEYPIWQRRWLVPAALVLLLVKSALAWMTENQLHAVIEFIANVLLAAGLLVFALTTLGLQTQAKRKVRDSHRDFWRLAMIHLIAAIGLWAVAEITGRQLFSILAAGIFLLGFAMAVITGMLLKIIAFLIWLHLQSLRDTLTHSNKPDFGPRNMKSIVSSRSSDYLLMLLIAAQIVLVGALVWPNIFSLPAALVWLVLFCSLMYVLVRALLYYRDIIAGYSV